ncbi:unnamed protein product [Amoebophrya sp. A25]|nr:unnamed protein product [Amoebophrya sp. A25]|eukprot:GSA25T00003551001.1
MNYIEEDGLSPSEREEVRIQQLVKRERLPETEDECVSYGELLLFRYRELRRSWKGRRSTTTPMLIKQHLLYPGLRIVVGLVVLYFLLEHDLHEKSILEQSRVLKDGQQKGQQGLLEVVEVGKEVPEVVVGRHESIAAPGGSSNTDLTTQQYLYSSPHLNLADVLFQSLSTSRALFHLVATILVCRLLVPSEVLPLLWMASLYCVGVGLTMHLLRGLIDAELQLSTPSSNANKTPTTTTPKITHMLQNPLITYAQFLDPARGLLHMLALLVNMGFRSGGGNIFKHDVRSQIMKAFFLHEESVDVQDRMKTMGDTL